jgi:hypothetical protein
MISSIYTYYNNLHQADDEYQNLLIELWTLSWKKKRIQPDSFN